jgi:hypothetical protein
MMLVFTGAGARIKGVGAIFGQKGLDAKVCER